MPAVHVSELWVWEIEIWGRFWGCDGWGDAEKPVAGKNPPSGGALKRGRRIDSIGGTCKFRYVIVDYFTFFITAAIYRVRICNYSEWLLR